MSQRLDIHKTYKLYIGGQFPRTESGRYYLWSSPTNNLNVNICRSSRKDFREAVVHARKAIPVWNKLSAINRGQILYRMAEMLEGRKNQFINELMEQGETPKKASEEVALSIDRLVYYAGWADKYQQIFSSVNPVGSSHFNFSIPEPTGVVSIIAPEESGLLGLISAIVPAITGGNTVVVLASQSKPLCAITLSEVLNSSDLPAGVVNILTGFRSELLEHFTTHMDINAVLYTGSDSKDIETVRKNSAVNVKRPIIKEITDWSKEEAQNPYFILDFMEIKTTWHPIGF